MSQAFFDLWPSETNVNEFTILRYSGKTPVLAVCTRCQLKFFTPSGMKQNSQEAEYYLRDKFRDHRCAAATEQKKMMAL
jgi:hypothetical protein